MNPLGRKLRERLLNGTWREKEDPMDNAGRDWSKWLPPAPLPDTGPKQMRATQVWASWPPGDNQFSPAIVRVAETTAHHAYLDVLAQIDEREDFCAVGTDGTWARHAVLVQDVGQAEPTPPEVLYGRAPCVGKWYSPASGTPFVLLRQKEPGTWVARDGGTDGLFVVMESFLAQCTPGPVTPSASAAIKATSVSIGKDGEMGVAFTRAPYGKCEHRYPSGFACAMSQPDGATGGMACLCKCHEARDGAIAALPPLAAPNPDEWEEDPSWMNGAGPRHPIRLSLGDSVVKVTEAYGGHGPGLLAVRVHPDGSTECHEGHTDHGVIWLNGSNKLMRRRQAVTGELLPGDVITLGEDSRWKLISIERHDFGDGVERWRAEPLTHAQRFARYVAFARKYVRERVPGWRAGQRRRIRLQSGGEHAGFFEGTVEPRIEEQSAGLWLLRRENSAAWGGETEWSELLAEAPAPTADVLPPGQCPCYDNSRFGPKPRCRLPAGHDGDHSGHADDVKCARCGAPRNVLPEGRGGTSRDAKGNAYCHEHRYLWSSTPAAADAIVDEVLAAASKALADPRGKPDQILVTRTVTLPGEAVFVPVTFTIPRPPLREVSSNGREWVRYGTVGTDAWPFESFKRRRVDGVDVGYVEPAPPACSHLFRDKDGDLTGACCAMPGTPRMTDVGLLTMCDEHFLSREADVAAVMRNHPTTHAARARMAEMDRRATVGPSPEPSCQPTLFGGIWRPW